MRSRRVEEQPRCGSEGRTPAEVHRSGYLDVTMVRVDLVGLVLVYEYI